MRLKLQAEASDAPGRSVKADVLSRGEMLFAATIPALVLQRLYTVTTTGATAAEPARADGHQAEHSEMHEREG